MEVMDQDDGCLSIIKKISTRLQRASATTPSYTLRFNVHTGRTVNSSSHCCVVFCYLSFTFSCSLATADNGCAVTPSFAHTVIYGLKYMFTPATCSCEPASPSPRRSPCHLPPDAQRGFIRASQKICASSG